MTSTWMNDMGRHHILITLAINFYYYTNDFDDQISASQTPNPRKKIPNETIRLTYTNVCTPIRGKTQVVCRNDKKRRTKMTQVKVMMRGRLVLCKVVLKLSMGIELEVRGGYRK